MDTYREECGVWVFVSLLFAFSVCSKIAQGDFGDYLVSMGMFPRWSIEFVTGGVFGLEIVTSIALVWPRLRRFGWLLVAGLGGAFAVIHIASAALGNVRACRCFGVQLSHDAFWHHVLMTVVCIGLVSAAAWSLRAKRMREVAVLERAG
jgi:hypothetical protein